MKKLFIVAIASTALLFGCGEEVPKTTGDIMSHLENRDDMRSYNLKFKNLNLYETEQGEDMLCGEIQFSRKSNMLPISTPVVLRSDLSKDVNEVVDGKKYFKFYFFKKTNSQSAANEEPIVIVDTNDSKLIGLWNQACNN
ncbi:hypothetical protein [Providencia heimbachae]|uniref:Lipoprotein n=1 Tax=Providencia heimbachae ATCC 35613 TaxID=1354272 RepID=A0A1B7K1E6_9GAMM|nr:hypothetical protein [Providencia heimbachae]OAT53980.1 hypothetical protein M998_0661 [Providencia heimbachae ATCC 35613]SQH13718.1 Uncharacterised protein [Providencia heimbachae]